MAAVTIATGCLRPDKAAPPAAAAAATCDAGRIADAVGQPVSDATAERWRILSGARTVRIVRAGTIITTEYRIGRLTIDVDATGLATRVACG